MDDLSNKTVTVYDYGYNIELAIRLRREFGRVFYFCPWKDCEPNSMKLAIGNGIDGVNRVRDFYRPNVIDETDLFVFPEIYDGDLQMDLQRRGKLVWGSRMAENLEYKRDLFAKTLEKVGLNAVGHKICNGFTQLFDHLREVEDVWIKTNLRGDGETWNFKNMVEGRRMLEAIAYRFGAIKEFIRFTVFESVESEQEVAYDGFMVTSPDGRPQFPKTGFLGYENKNMAHILTAIPYDQFPEKVREVNDLFAPELAKRLFRSAWGTEIKITGEGKSYFLDATCRQPSPPGEIIMEMVSNLGAFMYRGASGELIDLEVEQPFGVQVVIYSELSITNWNTIQIPEEIRRWVKLSRFCFSDGAFQIIPAKDMSPCPNGIERIGSVVATGETIEDAIESVKEYCDQVSGMHLTMEVQSLSECLNRIEEGQNLGVEFTDQTVPEPQEVM